MAFSNNINGTSDLFYQIVFLHPSVQLGFWCIIQALWGKFQESSTSQTCTPTQGDMAEGKGCYCYCIVSGDG